MGRLTRSDIIAAYELLLGRAPETEDTVDAHLKHKSVAEFLKTLVTSPEFESHWQRSPFFFFNAKIEAYAIIRAHENPSRQPKPGHIVNFLGVAMNLEFIGAARLDYTRCIASCVIGFANGMAPVTAVELGRRGLSSDMRPSSEEMEQMFKAMKSPPKA